MTQNVASSEVKSDNNLPQAPKSIESTLMSFVPMVLIFVVFYFLLIRPQEKKRKAQEKLVNGVKKGDEVITNSGIFGKIVKVNDSDASLELEISQGVTIRVLKGAVSNIIPNK
jgi:preprotein translocase subunit YajC